MNLSPGARWKTDGLDSGWRASGSPSLPEAHRSVVVAAGSGLRRFASFAGPGYLVAVGYIDPGNWATGLAGGSGFGYALLWVVLASNLMAMLLQALSARLGIASGRDLAQACRDHYARPTALALWLLCELAICATDLAEVIGTAVALNMLFKIPLAWGVCLTGADVLLVLWLQQRGFRYLEALTICLIALVLACFLLDVAYAHPRLADIASGSLPDRRIWSEPDMRYIALGILGATVMPHNLYLHSSIVQTRRYALDLPGRRSALRYATLDVVVALLIALVINASILVLSAAVFYGAGQRDITEIQRAYRLLSPLLGVGAASLLFGVALLASGKSSTLTATLTGQIVMEGFLAFSMPAWLRRLITRALAIAPALAAVLWQGERGIGRLLLLSQVVLSLQLPFAVIPLIRFTSDRAKMGDLVSPRWMTAAAWATAALMIALNVAVLTQACS
ncbi:MAG TPA: Nramp family divalent metal transporter [Polyangiaceae bacterium]|nr:Nramp family divalent metal transporter [Polyangiaceae bacterium]